MFDLRRLEDLLQPSTAVLVAGCPQGESMQLVADLSVRGCNVIGPVSTAGEALLMVTRAPVDVALVGRDLTGRRDSRDLTAMLHAMPAIDVIMLADLRAA